ncbi:hypothetical protein Cgig2_034082 [Carnegiea gigantea]|uniref:Uncharacterized protein n=1 Tax=Carnegiea gigantea TaxID=171969 RepID=A0A9Q1K0S1_9CARY|nr:hypothetical protein Cgig2_034082 [Carnegiea gigantea]
MACQRIEAYRHYSLEIIFTLKQMVDNLEQVKKRVEWMTCVRGYTRWIYHGEYAPSLKRPRKDLEEDNHLDNVCDEGSDQVAKDLRALALGPSQSVQRFQGYIANGFSDSRPLLNESLYEEDEGEVHAYSRDDMNDLVVEANNLNQPREFDGHRSENDSGHDDNESDVDATNNDAHSIGEDDIA